MHLNFLNFLNFLKILRSSDLVCDQHSFGPVRYQRHSLAVDLHGMVEHLLVGPGPTETGIPPPLFGVEGYRLDGPRAFWWIAAASVGDDLALTHWWELDDLNDSHWDHASRM